MSLHFLGELLYEAVACKKAKETLPAKTATLLTAMTAQNEQQITSIHANAVMEVKHSLWNIFAGSQRSTNNKNMQNIPRIYGESTWMELNGVGPKPETARKKEKVNIDDQSLWYLLTPEHRMWFKTISRKESAPKVPRRFSRHVWFRSNCNSYEGGTFLL